MIESGEIPVILSSVKGSRLPCLATLAGSASFAPATVRRYGKTVTVHAAVIQCLWHGVFAARAVQVVLIRDRAQDGYDLALATTDLAASPAHLIERYASRWSIEMVFPQLAKGPVRPVRGGWQHVADLDIAAGDDYAVDEQLGQLPPLREGGGGQPGPDGLAECLDPASYGGEFQSLPGGGVQLALLGQ